MGAERSVSLLEEDVQFIARQYLQLECLYRTVTGYMWFVHRMVDPSTQEIS